MEVLAMAEAQPRGVDRSLRLVPDYAVPHVSDKVLRIILSYTDYVRRVVWGQA
jgi:UDP-N-acetylglucosamine 2-epimerase (non-hydrolysing)